MGKWWASCGGDKTLSRHLGEPEKQRLGLLDLLQIPSLDLFPAVFFLLGRVQIF